MLDVTNSGYFLVPAVIPEIEVKLMGTFEVELISQAMVRGELREPGEVVEVNRQERDSLVASNRGFDTSEDEIFEPPLEPSFETTIAADTRQANRTPQTNEAKTAQRARAVLKTQAAANKGTVDETPNTTPAIKHSIDNAAKQ